MKNKALNYLLTYFNALHRKLLPEYLAKRLKGQFLEQ